MAQLEIFEDLTYVPEAIESLANCTEILHGLVGTYELLALHDIGEQLSRRSVYIHLHRYNAEYSEDRGIWQSVIGNFQCDLPLSETPDLVALKVAVTKILCFQSHSNS